MKQKQIILLLMTTVLVSCNQIWFINEKIMLGTDGYVYSTTNEPIDSVTVIIYRDKRIIDTVYTDNTGYFHGIKWERCFFCPTLKYEFKKIDYVSKTVVPQEYYFNNQTPRQLQRWDSLAVVLDMHGVKP